jgi:hypothetical protein
LLSERNVEKLLRALSDSDWAVRAKAAAALGTLRDASAVPLLCKALDGGFLAEAEDQEAGGLQAQRAAQEACTAVAFALGNIGGDEAVSTLVKKMPDIQWTELGRAVALAGKSAVPLLLRELQKPDQDICVLYGVLVALGGIRDSRAFSPIVDLLSHENFNVGNSAIAALGRLGDNRAIGVLRSLSDKKPADDHSQGFILGALGHLLEAPDVRRELLPQVLNAQRPCWQYIDDAIAAWGDRADGALIPDLISLFVASESIESKAVMELVWYGVNRALSTALTYHAALISRAQLEVMQSMPDKELHYCDEFMNENAIGCSFADVREMANELLAR